jgi:hypothetical protein
MRADGWMGSTAGVVQGVGHRPISPRIIRLFARHDGAAHPTCLPRTDRISPLIRRSGGQSNDTWTYLVLFLIVFGAMGLVIAPFLPIIRTFAPFVPGLGLGPGPG